MDNDRANWIRDELRQHDVPEDTINSIMMWIHRRENVYEGALSTIEAANTFITTGFGKGRFDYKHQRTLAAAEDVW